MSSVSKEAGTVASAGPLTKALRAASEKAEEDHQQVIRDRLIQYHGDVYGFASAYDNGIIIAGYAAFFTLWVGVNAELSPLCRLVTVALMSASLLLYMAWHILQMMVRQTYEFRKANLFQFAQDAERFNTAWVEVEKKATIAQGRILLLWPWVFVPCVALGLAGGITLSYNALAAILNWPQLA